MSCVLCPGREIPDSCVDPHQGFAPQAAKGSLCEGTIWQSFQVHYKSATGMSLASRTRPRSCCTSLSMPASLGSLRLPRTIVTPAAWQQQPAGPAAESADLLRAIRGAARRSAQRLRGLHGVVAHASAASSGGADARGDSADLGIEQRPQLVRFLAALYQFSRPHTMAGTTISILSMSVLALNGAHALSQPVLVGLAQALGTALLMNISIVG